jgi:hypothetical protein
MDVSRRTIWADAPSLAVSHALKSAHDNPPTRHGDPFGTPIPTKLRLNVPDLFTIISITGRWPGVLDGSRR